MQIEVSKVCAIKTRSSATYYIRCNHAIAPVGDDVFAILGKDRLLYVSIDSEMGKDIAVRVIKGTAWNVTKVKVRKYGKRVAYGIPKKFAENLGIKQGEYMLILIDEDKIEIIPLKLLIDKIGKFEEPIL